MQIFYCYYILGKVNFTFKSEGFKDFKNRTHYMLFKVDTVANKS